MLYTDEEIKRRRKRDEKVKRTINTIAYIILIPLLLYNISLIIQAIIKPDKTPSFFGIKTYVIISGSMQPELNVGDIVIVKKVGEKELERGDIISYRHGQEIITHRIVNKEEINGETIYITKGDSNNVEDMSNITIESIEGKVVNSIPKIGELFILLRNRMIIIYVMIGLYIYMAYSHKQKRKKSERTRKRLEYENNHNEQREEL